MQTMLETERLRLRELEEGDLPALRRILRDPVTMRAYEGAFDEAEVLDWLRNQQRRYREEGRGLWAVLLKDGGEMIGQCGLTYQSWGERRVLEVGYLFERAFWHRGYATEAARACRDYAFDRLGAQEVFSIIRDSNFASQAVARRNGMTLRGDFVKHYRGVDMPHLVFSIRREERDGEAGAAVAGGGTLHIRAYDPADLPEMTAIWNAVVEGGNAFPQRESLSPPEAAAFFAGQTYTGVALRGGEVVGLYILHPNNIGRCGHIANASYAVKTGLRGLGIGEALVRDCMRQGAGRGFRVLQFNAVVADNAPAVHLYEKLGFHRLGRIPGGFAADTGYKDILLFYIELPSAAQGADDAGV